MVRGSMDVQSPAPPEAARCRKAALWGSTAATFAAAAVAGFFVLAPLLKSALGGAEAPSAAKFVYAPMVPGAAPALRSVRPPLRASAVAVAVALDASAVDLTPAYKKFPTVPASLELLLDVPGAPQLSFDAAAVPTGPEPFGYVGGDIDDLSKLIPDLVSTQHPVLLKAATQLLSKRQQGKRFRPTLVVTMALAAAAAKNTSADAHRASDVYRKQKQLAQITEMIHVASLIHDDVLDEAETRRGELAVHQMFSNKIAVLAGDYLLATASELLADIGDTRVVKIMASALKSLVQGEIMQMEARPEEYLDMEMYVRKSYYKTASLMTLSARSCAVLGGHDLGSDVARAAEEYGYHLGLAFQIIDDILDFTASSDILGKPAAADMELGLATAPVLYALEHDTSLRPLIMRRFKEKGDVKKAFDSVHSEGGVAIDKSRKLAHWHAQRAVDAIYRLPPSDARSALVRVTHLVLTRAK